MPASRDDVLARYRRWRAISKEQQTAAFRNVSRSALLKHARSLGMLRGRTIVGEHENDIQYVWDLAVHTRRPGATAPLDRYARQARLDPASDEARVLEALRTAWFSIFMVQGRHEVAGLVLKDLMRGSDVWLMDEALSASAEPGFIMATRLCVPDAFAMTCGVAAPLDPETLAGLVDFMTEAGVDDNLARIAADPRFAPSIYRMAMELGLTELIGFR